MPKVITFELSPFYSDDDIQEYFQEHIDELRPAMDLDIGQEDDGRLQIDEIEIEQIDLSEDSIFIQFTLEFSAYYGCDDANFSDIDHRDLTGRRSGNTFTFDVFVYPQRQSPADEL